MANANGLASEVSINGGSINILFLSHMIRGVGVWKFWFDAVIFSVAISKYFGARGF